MYLSTRIPKSKIALVNSLLDLLRQKSYHSITIQEICDQANVVRSTFYRHFTDKTDALVTLVNHFTDLAKTTTLDAFFTIDHMNLRQNILRTYQIILKYHRVVQTLFDLHLPEIDFEENIRHILQAKIQAIIDSTAFSSSLPQELVSNLYTTNALLVTKYIAYHPDTVNLEELTDFMVNIYLLLLGQIEAPIESE